VAAPLQTSLSGMHARRRQAGFTLVEMMVVLIIIAVLSAMLAPRLTRNRQAQDGREYASGVANQLQRLRMEAISSRLPMYAFVYSDHIDLRTATPGATLAAAPVAPTTSSPILRTITADPRVTILDVSNTAVATPSTVLSASVSKTVVFSTLGVGFIGPTAPSTPTPVYLYVDNANIPSAHPDRHYRIDVAGLTGFVELRNTW
jgi:prepilin-type N-terminal cleavage/methylation domain-containing protein